MRAYRAPREFLISSIDSIGHTGYIYGIRISDDSRFIVTGSWDGLVGLWKVSNDYSIEFIKFLNVGRPVYDVDISSNNKLVAAGGDDGLVTIWDISDIHNPRLINRLVYNPNTRIRGLKFYRDKYLIAGDSDGNIIVWDISCPENADQLGAYKKHDGAVYDIAIYYDILATASKDKTIGLRDLSNIKEISLICYLSFGGGIFRSVAINNDILLAGTQEKTIEIRDISGIIGSNAHEIEGIKRSTSVDYKDIILRDNRLGIKHLTSIKEHTGTVYRVRISDNNIIASVSWDHRIGIRRFAGNNVQMLGMFNIHEGAVRSVDVSRDGRLIVAGSDDRKVSVIKVDEDKPRFVLYLSRRPKISSIAYDSWSNTLAIAYQHGRIDVIKHYTTPEASTRSIMVGNKRIKRIKFSEDGSYIIVFYDDGSVDVYETESLKLEKSLTETLNSLDGKIADVAIYSKGLLAIALESGIVKILLPLESIPFKIGKIRRVYILDYRLLAVGESKIVVLDIFDKKILSTYQVPSEIIDVDFGVTLIGNTILVLDNQSVINILSIDSDGTLKSVNKVEIKAGRPTLARLLDNIRNLAFIILDNNDIALLDIKSGDYAITENKYGKIYGIVPSGNRIITIHEGGLKVIRKITLDDKPLITFVRAITNIERLYRAIKIGNYLYTSSDTNYILVRHYSKDNLKLLRRVSGHNSSIYYLEICKKRHLLASASDDSKVVLWDISNPKEPKVAAVLEGHKRPVYTVAFSSDCNLLVSGSDDKTVRIRCISDLNNVKEISTLFHDYNIYGVAISPDDKYIASGERDGTLRIYKLDISPNSIGASELIRLKRHNGAIYNIKFASEDILVTASNDKRVGIRDISKIESQADEIESKMLEHDSPVFCVEFTEDRRYMLTGSEDGKLAIWRFAGLETKPHEVFRPHEDAIRGIYVDGNIAITASLDGKVSLIDLSDEKRGKDRIIAQIDVVNRRLSSPEEIMSSEGYVYTRRQDNIYATQVSEYYEAHKEIPIRKFVSRFFRL